MAGVKGRSGGSRPGAGRKANPKPAPPDVGAVAGQQPLDFLLMVQNDPQAPLKDRVRAAIAAAQYVHMKKGDGGKRDETADKAKKAAVGKFKAAPAPLKLVQH